MNAAHIINRSDALYCGIAMTVTILELALISTNPHLGDYALEITLILQLIISASLEFYAGTTLSLSYGIGKTMMIGFILKLTSAVFFMTGLYLSYQGLVISTWSCLLLAFSTDAIGTGCLKSTFRPTYNRIHLTLTGQSADYAKATFQKLTLRLLLPLTLLILASYLLSHLSGALAAMLILSTVIACRTIQILYAYHDLKHLPLSSFKNPPAHCFSTSQLIKAFNNNRTAFYGFLTGNIFESVILMYAIGLLYKYKNHLPLEEFESWLGSSLIAFALYLISVIIGGGLLARPLGSSLPKPMAYVFFIMTLTSTLWMIFNTTEQVLFYALTAFSITGSIIGIVLMRSATNIILTVSNDLEAVAFFLLAEIVTALVIAIIAAIGTFVFSPDYLIKGFGLGITSIMSIYFLYLYRVKTNTSKK